MPAMRQAAPLTMEWCLDCHRHPAKALRPLDKVFATNWAPPKNSRQLEDDRIVERHIHLKNLADCSVCHR